MCKKKCKVVTLLFYAVLNSFFYRLFSLDADDFNFDDICLDLPEDYANNPTLRSDNSTVQELALYLSNYIKQPLWEYTRVPPVRDVLYLMPQVHTEKKKWEFAVNFFYNEVPHMKINIGNLLQKNVITHDNEIISLLLQNVTNLDDRIAVVAFFKKITIQERRIGALMQAQIKKGPIMVQLHTPLLINERNFWLGMRDRHALLTILQIDESVIPKKEFYKVKYGIGDTRIALGYDVLKSFKGNLNVGFQAIIPTSKLSYSSKYEINLENIAQISDIDDLKREMLKNVRNIRNYLIDPRFGNSGHFGIGVFVAPHVHFFDDQLHLFTKVSLDALFAAHEDRLFFFKQTLSADDMHGNEPDAVVGQKAYNYLRQYVFPSSFNVMVCPGIIFNGVVAGSVDFGNVQFTVGYDFYMQNKECFSKINNARVSLADLRVHDAESLQAMQHKLFSEALYKIQPSITISFGGDVAIMSTALGKDWTMYLKTAFLF